MSSKNDLDPNQPAPPPKEEAAAQAMAYAMALLFTREYPDATEREIARTVAFFMPEVRDQAYAMAAKVLAARAGTTPPPT